MKSKVSKVCIYLHHISIQKKPCGRTRTTRQCIGKQTIFVHFTKSVKSMEKFQIPTENQYQNAYEDFLDTTLFSRLQEKFVVKPFYLRYKLLRSVMLTASYGINFFSAATAFTCVFVFTNTLLQNNLFSGVFGMSFLVLLEMFKRLMIPEFCKNILQFRKVNWLKAIAIVSLMCISVSLSYFGAKDSILLFTPKVELTNVEDTKKEHKSRIMILEKRLDEISKMQSWHGKLTPKGQKVYNSTTEQISRIEADMLQNTNRITSKNDELSVKHSEKTFNNASVFSIFTLFLDLSLIGLLLFCEYYDYRSFVEFAQESITVKQANSSNDDTNGKGAFTSSNGVATTYNGIDERVVGLAIKNAKANLAAYDSKIRNNEGNIETNQKGRERWWNELQQLESKLSIA
jgi:hypothetical protein